jgi:hypothetical protein
VPSRQVEQERARARGARRLIPWVVGSAASAGVLVWVAGGGWRGALTIGALGLLFGALVLAFSVARCPRCGTPLPRGAASGEGCPSCGAER